MSGYSSPFSGSLRCKLIYCTRQSNVPHPRPPVSTALSDALRYWHATLVSISLQTTTPGYGRWKLTDENITDTEMLSVPYIQTQPPGFVWLSTCSRTGFVWLPTEVCRVSQQDTLCSKCVDAALERLVSLRRHWIVFSIEFRMSAGLRKLSGRLEEVGKQFMWCQVGGGEGC